VAKGLSLANFPIAAFPPVTTFEALHMFPILLLDDAAEDRMLAERILRNCKILNPILSFQTGEELLEYFAGDFEPPALVLVDMMMKPMSGNDVLRAIKKLGFIEDLPFVMVSGLADFRTLQEGYQNGARTFIIKPLKQDDILQVLSSVKGLAVHPVEGGNIIAPERGESLALRTLKFGT
jgi:CheY-like chemotaxis protein